MPENKKDDHRPSGIAGVEENISIENSPCKGLLKIIWQTTVRDRLHRNIHSYNFIMTNTPSSISFLLTSRGINGINSYEINVLQFVQWVGFVSSIGLAGCPLTRLPVGPLSPLAGYTVESVRSVMSVESV